MNVVSKVFLYLSIFTFSTFFSLDALAGKFCDQLTEKVSRDRSLNSVELPVDSEAYKKCRYQLQQVQKNCPISIVRYCSKNHDSKVSKGTRVKMKQNLAAASADLSDVSVNCSFPSKTCVSACEEAAKSAQDLADQAEKLKNTVLAETYLKLKSEVLNIGERCNDAYEVGERASQQIDTNSALMRQLIQDRSIAGSYE